MSNTINRIRGDIRKIGIKNLYKFLNDSGFWVTSIYLSIFFILFIISFSQGIIPVHIYLKTNTLNFFISASIASACLFAIFNNKTTKLVIDNNTKVRFGFYKIQEKDIYSEEIFLVDLNFSFSA